jgi:ssRNA-specific RNase YbeY (16S rRNA maturation enzyme)
MESTKEYVISCWHCGASFDAVEAAFCNHNDPTKVCPFCINCFCDAPQQVRDKFFREGPRELLEEKKKFQTGGDKKLGELLIKAGKVTDEQLTQAIEKQKENKRQLGEILVEMGLVTTEEIKVFLVDQKEIDEINLEGLELDLGLVQEVGNVLCLSYKFIPIELLENGKILRFAVPSNEVFHKIKNSKVLSEYVLIPYLGDPVKIRSLLQQIRDTDVFVLK